MIYRSQFAKLHHETRPASLLDPLPPDSARALDQWLDALHELSLDGWLAVAAADHDGQPVEREREAARRAVIAVIADRRLEVTAWFIKDMVSTAAHTAARLAAQASQTRQHLASARAAAEWAALAVATEPWLDPRHVALLCDPLQRAGLRLAPATSRPRARRPAEHFVGDQPSRSRERED